MFLEEYDQEQHYKTLFKEGYEDGFHDGFHNGSKSGEERIRALFRCLAADNRNADILRAASNPEFQKELLKEYGL